MADWLYRASILLRSIADKDERDAKREDFEHRAGVCEFDGGMDRREAERIAYEELRDRMLKDEKSSTGEASRSGVEKKTAGKGELQ